MFASRSDESTSVQVVADKKFALANDADQVVR